MIVGGVLLLLLAVIFLFVARTNAGKLQALNAVDTYDTATLSAIHRRITTALGANDFTQPCEVTGVIECATPLTGPVSGQALVAYLHTTHREYEERIITHESGRSTTRIERRSEQLGQNERRVPFTIRDDSGQVLVVADGAQIDLIETANRFVETTQPWPSATRTLGQRQFERGLEVGARVFVSGTAIDQNGQVVITRHPNNSKQPFIISRKSEHELANSAATWARNMRYAAIASGVIGLALVFGGVLMGG